MEVNLRDMPAKELAQHLRERAMTRPDFEPVELVLLTGREVLAIADRLARQ
jgi:hypothetical protein